MENQNKLTLVKFGEAIEAAKNGKLIARNGWNGKGMFVFQRAEDSLKLEFIIEKVKSLPDALKEYYRSGYSDEMHWGLEVKFTAYLCMKAADGTIVNGWLASQTDILAEDWIIL